MERFYEACFTEFIAHHKARYEVEELLQNLLQSDITCQGFFCNHLLHAVVARSALFENYMPYFVLKTPKIHAV